MLECPGRKSNAHLDSTLLECPACGREVEIFADEPRVHCRCGHWVLRDTLPMCADWCSEAERCFGTVGSPTVAVPDSADQKEQERRLGELREQIELALGKCSKPEVKKGKPAQAQ